MLDETRPLFSIVLPVKNRKEYLSQALVSLQNQTLQNWECIIVDDYSEDDIKSLVESFNDTRFAYYKNPNDPGQACARNYGNSLATADWIAVADSDDIYLPRRLEVTLQAIQKNPNVDVVHANMYLLLEEGYEIRTVKSMQQYNRKVLYEKNIISHITSAYKRELAITTKYSEKLASAIDYDLWLSFADKHAVFVYIDEPLALYRRHSGQISTNPNTKIVQTENAKLVQQQHPYIP